MPRARMSGRGLKALMLIVVLALAGTARAEDSDRELARSRFATGQALYKRGRFAEALAEFEAAKQLLHSPAFDFNIGMCLANLDRPAEAADALERYVNARPDDPDASSIWRKIAELRAEVMRRNNAPKTEAKVEPRPPPPVPPPATEPTPPPSVTPPPPPGELQPVPTFAEQPVDARRRTRTRAAIATAVVGGALLITGAALGGTALAQRASYDQTCDAGHCDQPQYYTAHNEAIATDVLIAFGAAAGVTSIVLFATRPKAHPVSLAPAVGRGAAALTLSGAF